MTDRSDGGPAIHIAWECLSNFIRDDAFSARLVLRNDGCEPIAPGWTLCFNTCRKILAETVSAGYAIAHVNGDLFALSMPGGDAWLPGQTHALDYEALHWAISITDAPLGFYLLPAQGGAAVDLGDPVIAPFVRPEQRHRNRGDAAPTADAAWRFAQNAALSYLHEAEVGRITPRPRAACFTGGQYRLGRDAALVHGAGLDNEVRFLRALLADLAPGEGVVTLNIGPVAEAGDEAYSLDIDDQGVVLRGASAHGVFNGLQSLAQLVSPDGTLPLGAVQDAPRYAYRGMMLDVARHFSSIDTVLRLLDCMAAYKLNRFHFHLTDDEGWRLEIAALPELTAIGAQRGAGAERRR
jgi:hexosaminidase